MKGKGSGWHGESRRHSLARRGIKTVPHGRIMTAYGIQYDGNGDVMVAEGILGDIWDKAKSTVTKSAISTKLKEIGSKIKRTGNKIKRTVTGKPRTPEQQTAHLEKLKAQKEKREVKKAKEHPKALAKKTKDIQAQFDRSIEESDDEQEKQLKKKLADVKKQMTESQEEELEQASDFGKKPSKEEVDIDNKGRVGAIVSKIRSEEHKVPREELTDLPEEVFESPDADSLIALSENAEKLIDYKNEMEYDINMLKVERKRLRSRFGSDETKEFRDLKADRMKARSDFERKKDQLKMSGMDESKIRQKITKAESEYKQEYQQREIELVALRNRNRVTLKFLDELTNDLGMNVKKMDKHIKRMTASGINKEK